MSPSDGQKRVAATKRRFVFQWRRIGAGWHVGIFRNRPFVILDFYKLRVEIAYAFPHEFGGLVR